MSDHGGAAHPLVARWHTRPVIGSRGAEVDASWVVEVDGGAAGAGPAGTAALRLPSGGVVEVDHADPDRLLVVSIPVGRTSTGRLDDPMHGLGAGRVSDLDRALLVSLVGDESATDAVERRPAWTTVGRLALLASTLRRRSLPLEGLWALEAATLIDLLDLGRPGRTWADSLAATASEAVGLVERRWIELLPDPVAELVLLHTLANAERADLGELGDWARAHVGGGVASLEQMLAVAAESAGMDAERELTLVGGPLLGQQHATLGGGDLPGEWSRPETFVDPSVQGLLTSPPMATVDGVDLHVTAHLDPRVSASALAAGLLSTRVTDAAGRLLAAAAAMHPSGPDRASVSLCLGREVRPDELVVVVGHELPFAALTASDHRRRVAVEASQRAVDALRRRSGWALPLDGARLAWLDAGDEGRAAAIGEVEQQPAFLGEQVEDAGRDGSGPLPLRADVPPDARWHGAVRHQRLLADDAAGAARAERERRGLEPAASIPPWATTALAFAAWRADDRDTGRSLDDAVLDELYGPGSGRSSAG